MSVFRFVLDINGIMSDFMYVYAMHTSKSTPNACGNGKLCSAQSERMPWKRFKKLCFQRFKWSWVVSFLVSVFALQRAVQHNYGVVSFVKHIKSKRRCVKINSYSRQLVWEREWEKKNATADIKQKNVCNSRSIFGCVIVEEEMKIDAMKWIEERMRLTHTLKFKLKLKQKRECQLNWNRGREEWGGGGMVKLKAFVQPNRMKSRYMYTHTP